MQMLFAATHPGRTAALVLMSTYARLLQAADYPEGVPSDVLEMVLRRVDEGWGEGVLMSGLLPGLVRSDIAREYWARFQRSAATPSPCSGRSRSSSPARAAHPSLTACWLPCSSWTS